MQWLHILDLFHWVDTHPGLYSEEGPRVISGERGKFRKYRDCRHFGPTLRNFRNYLNSFGRDPPHPPYLGVYFEQVYLPRLGIKNLHISDVSHRVGGNPCLSMPTRAICGIWESESAESTGIPAISGRIVRCDSVLPEFV